MVTGYHGNSTIGSEQPRRPKPCVSPVFVKLLFSGEGGVGGGGTLRGQVQLLNTHAAGPCADPRC